MKAVSRSRSLAVSQGTNRETTKPRNRATPELVVVGPLHPDCGQPCNAPGATVSADKREAVRRQNLTRHKSAMLKACSGWPTMPS